METVSKGAGGERKGIPSLFWNLSYDDLLGVTKKVGAQSASKRGEAG
jgi:hypothetical protein